ncbi:MAG: transglycosylase SLT domain-containing protein [Candidatus Saganbacteria bacterium]|nr:transglycosylase SLT domain-containing protein [Candidatus Saganbacteria bacterium]
MLPDAYILIGKCRLDSHKNKAAADVFSYLLKKHPGNRLEALAHYLLAESIKRQKKYKQAYNLYHHIDTYYPLSAYAKKSRINMRKLEKKYKFREPKASAKALYEKGKKYWKNYRYKEAAAMFTKLMKQHPKSKYVNSALYMTGLAEYETKNYSSAINTLERNIKARGSHRKNSYYYLGRAYGRRGKYEKAVNALQYFISLHPKSPLADNAYYYIGYYHEIEKDFDSAVTAYDNLLKKYPISPIADVSLWRLGRIYYRQGNHDYARRYFAQAFNYPVGTYTHRCIYWWGKLTEVKSKKEAAALYAYVINNFDHTYYSYRADEKLKKLGYQSPLNYDNIKQSTPKENEELSDRAKLLLEAGLTQYAKYEAGPAPDNSYHSSLGLVLHKYGEYRAPMGLAEKKINGAILKGEAGKIQKTTWQLAYPKGFWTYVTNSSKEYNVDPYLVLALIKQESRFTTKARSRSYARGLMQIISSTAKRICRALKIPYSYSRLYKPETNIRMGTYYLSTLIKRFNGNTALALAGYNGGPVRVKRWVNEWYNGDTRDFDLDDFVINIPIKETRQYVEKVLGNYYQYKRIYD